MLVPGPDKYDRKFIALNQVIKYHEPVLRLLSRLAGRLASPPSGPATSPISTDLIHWKKFPGNPLRPLSENRSSNLLIDDGKQFRLYTMHDAVWVYFPAHGASQPSN